MTSVPSVRHALFLARLGLSVLWKRSPAGGPVKGRGKAPVMLGWNAQPCQSPAQLVKVYRPGYNLGLHTGAVTGCAIQMCIRDRSGTQATGQLSQSRKARTLQADLTVSTSQRSAREMPSGASWPTCTTAARDSAKCSAARCGYERTA